MTSTRAHPLGYGSETVKLSSGHHYRYVDIPPPQGVKHIVTALLIHGFPDSAYGWRHQIKGWSQRGIRLIIPDTIGYTGSSQPVNPEAYSMKAQSDELAELVQTAGVPDNEKIVLIAHDWGAAVATRMAQFKPELVKGVVSLGIPFAPPAQQYLSVEQYVEKLPNFGYQLFFASPHSDTIIDADASTIHPTSIAKLSNPRQVEKFINMIYESARQYASAEGPRFEKEGVIEAWLKDDTKSMISDLLSKEELNTIVSEIKSGVGFTAMLNYYRTRKINYELEKDLPQDLLPHTLKLLVVPDADPAIPAAMSAQVEKRLKSVEVVWLKGLCGHWVQLEQPGEIERIVGEWVEKMDAKGWQA